MKNLILKYVSILLICITVLAISSNTSFAANNDGLIKNTKLRYTSINQQDFEISATKKTMYIGDIYQLKVMDEKLGIKYKSSNTTIATVNSEGLVRAKASGKVTIEVKTEDGKYEANCIITVKVPVSKIFLNEYQLVMERGEIFKLKATVYPTNASTKKLEYKSTDTDVITVNSSGRIKAVGVGKACVVVNEANNNNKKAVVEITVYRIQ